MSRSGVRTAAWGTSAIMCILLVNREFIPTWKVLFFKIMEFPFFIRLRTSWTSRQPTSDIDVTFHASTSGLLLIFVKLIIHLLSTPSCRFLSVPHIHIGIYDNSPFNSICISSLFSSDSKIMGYAFPIGLSLKVF